MDRFGPLLDHTNSPEPQGTAPRPPGAARDRSISAVSSTCSTACGDACTHQNALDHCSCSAGELSEDELGTTDHDAARWRLICAAPCEHRGQQHAGAISSDTQDLFTWRTWRISKSVFAGAAALGSHQVHHGRHAVSGLSPPHRCALDVTSMPFFSFDECGLYSHSWRNSIPRV